MMIDGRVGRQRHSITSSLFADHDLDTATLMAYLMSQQPGP
jgi:hypothetical protein